MLILWGFTLLPFVAFIIGSFSHKYKEKPLSLDGRASLLSFLSESDHNDTEQEVLIHKLAEKLFIEYQNDWSNANIKGVQRYSTIGYYEHASLMIQLLEGMGRRNVVKELKVNKISLLSEVNEKTKLPVNVGCQINFNGHDILFDKKTSRPIYQDRAYGVSEIWVFVWDGKELLLDKIVQPTSSLPHKKEGLAEFAEENNLHYSPDWGRYALPTRGIIFNDIDLHLADVNNHVLGLFNECIIQMYTYSKVPANPDSYYLVGQISLPKKYNGVFIRSTSSTNRIYELPETYKKITLEWDDFNDKYQVFSHNKDIVAAFELLNPKFMSSLFDRRLDYNIEVIDNNVYIFAPVTSTNSDDYRELFEILSLAFKELKM